MEPFPASRKCHKLCLNRRGRTIELGRHTCVMGILNITPDSFSDGGSYFHTQAATDHALLMEKQGADIIDIGGESTRPGATAITVKEEIRRVVPVIEAIREHSSVAISIDTQKAEVARAALSAGADIVNDVSAFRYDPSMQDLVAAEGCPAVLMHMAGSPKTMQKSPRYRNVLEDVRAFLYETTGKAISHGIDPSLLIIDPGIGFGKTLQHNLSLLRGIPALATLGFPVLIGSSRKAMIGSLTGRPAGERVIGTMATVAFSAAAGAHIVRVHDVPETVDTIRIVDSILAGSPVEPHG